MVPYPAPAATLNNWLFDHDPLPRHAITLPHSQAGTTVATHTLNRDANIVLDINLWRDGIPEELSIEFTSEAGSALQFTVDSDGWVRTRTESAQLSADLTDQSNIMTVHLSQKDPFGFQILGPNSFALSGPLDNGITDVNMVRVATSDSTGKWHIGTRTQTRATAGFSVSHTIPPSRIQTIGLRIVPVGPPQDLSLELRGPAGTSLNLSIGKDGEVHAGPHTTRLPPGAWSNQTVEPITIHLDTATAPYTFMVFYGHDRILKKPLPTQITNSDHLILSAGGGAGYWQISGATFHRTDKISISTAAPGIPTSADVQLTRRINEVLLTFADGTMLTQTVDRIDGQTVEVQVPVTAPAITGVRALPLDLAWAASANTEAITRGATLPLVPHREPGTISTDTGRGLTTIITLARALALLSTMIALGETLTRPFARRMQARTRAVSALVIGPVALATLSIPYLLGDGPMPSILRLAITVSIGTMTLWWVLTRASSILERSNLHWTLAASVLLLFQVTALSLIASWDDLRLTSTISGFEGDYLVPYTMAQDMRHNVPIEDTDVWGFPFGSRTPLFPLTYLGSTFLFGDESLRATPFSEPPTRWHPEGATVYMVLVAVTTALMALTIGLLAASWAGPRAGDLATALVAMNPMFIWIAFLSPYRALLVVLLVGSVYLLAKPQSKTHTILGAVAAALAYAAGKLALPFIPGLAILPWSAAGRQAFKLRALGLTTTLVGITFAAWLLLSQPTYSTSEWAFLLPFLTETHNDELRTQSTGTILGDFIEVAANDPLALIRDRLVNVGRVLVPGLFLDIDSFTIGVVRIHLLTLSGLLLLPIGLFGFAGIGIAMVKRHRESMRLLALGLGFFFTVFVLRGSDAPGLLVAVGLPLAALLVVWSAHTMIRSPKLGLLAVSIAAIEAALVAHTFWGETLQVPGLALSVVGMTVLFFVAWAATILLAVRSLSIPAVPTSGPLPST